MKTILNNFLYCMDYEKLKQKIDTETEADQLLSENNMQSSLEVVSSFMGNNTRARR